jgi:endonuclease/exonuclease/phosphatase family metal-dependent hydrolase
LFLGVVFCLLGAGCDSKTTPDWPGAAASPVVVPEVVPEVAAIPERVAEGSGVVGEPLRMVAYNLQNYLEMERVENGVRVPDAPKQEASIAALVAIIVGLDPDVLGVAEIGTLEDAHDLRRRLAAAGLSLPHLEFTHGSDPVRRQALFSRFPIIARNSVSAGSFTIHGQRASLLRGFLDVTIDRDGTPLRIVGAHLKSRREVAEYDQQLHRQAEAQLLRRHLDAIFAADPDAALIVYGDFNDTRQSATVRTIQGNRQSPEFLEAVNLTDSRGQGWTHYWAAEDSYSRIDFICVSRALAAAVDRSGSGIPHPPGWLLASDHRPLLLILR